MSDIPKSGASGTVSHTEVDFPAGLFFEAGDYTEANTRPEDLEETRRRVARHRSKLKATVALLLEDLARINSSLHAADRQGNAAPHWDSAVALKGKLDAAISHLADQLDKAVRRYEASFDAPPPIPPAAAAPPPAAAGAPPAAGASAVVVTMDRPSSIGFPGSVAYLSRIGQVNGMSRGRS